MRDRHTWYAPVVEALRPWPDEYAQIKPAALCQVELGLRLLERLDPDRPANGVWPLLGGYPFAVAAGLASDERSRQLIVNARHLLWTLRRNRLWQQGLEMYDSLPERLRGYRIVSADAPARRIEPMIAAGRFAVYDAALESLPALDRNPLPLAAVGTSRFVDRRRRTSVTLPEELVLTPAAGHDLEETRKAAGDPLTVPLAELAEIAKWMDTTETERNFPRRGNWESRLVDMKLDARTDDGLGFAKASALRLDRLVHLVGMVGAGKSTLMTLIAVWGARQGLRTTLVVGDVAEQLTLTALFRALDLSAAPVLGPTTRERHVQRLHRRIAARSGQSLLMHDDPGFVDLSTVCVLDAQRGLDAREPLRYVDAPCTALHPLPSKGGVTAETSEDVGRYREIDSAPSPQRDEDELGRRHGCPIWSGCPRHSSARELVNALIWVANPASLVQTAVPRHLNAERLRHLELACLRSDIVIVDEADRVQMQLDEAFAPSATLVMRGPESWLDRLDMHKIEELARQGRLPLSDRDVERWAAALDVVSTTTNRLYAMLINDESLRDWAEIDYFSAWTLQEKLLAEWYPSTVGVRGEGSIEALQDEAELFSVDDEEDDFTVAQGISADAQNADVPPWTQRRIVVTRLLDSFRDDPLGDHGPYNTTTDDLVRATQDLVLTLDEGGTRRRVKVLLAELLSGAPGLAKEDNWPAPIPRKGRDLVPADIRASEDWYDRTAQRLEFTLLLAALHQRLTRVTFLWPQVEAALHLDATDNELSRRPPLDYAPIVPEAPMGNVLGFQYLPDDRDRTPDIEGRCTGTLRFFRCAGVGRELLHALPDLGADRISGRPGPHVLLMSGTSWAGTSTRAHILAPVQAVLKPDDKAIAAIRGTTFRTNFLYDEQNRPFTLSGQDHAIRNDVLKQLVSKLARPGRGGTPSPIEAELAHIADPRRRRALLLVGSYREAETTFGLLHEMPRWRGRVKVLARDDADLDETTDEVLRAPDRHPVALRRGELATFAEDEEAELLIAPLMAIERGHNILSPARTPNEERVAAFGSVFFLVRPHPRPDDLSLAIFAINDWVTRFVRNQIPHPEHGTFHEMVGKAGTLGHAGLTFRHIARTEWLRLLTRRYVYSRLSEAEKQSFAWDQLVSIWQVIGRLVRGGVPARVVFVDAAFAPALAEALAPSPMVDQSLGMGDEPEKKVRRRKHAADGLLARLHDVLAPYFDPTASPADFAEPSDPALVRMLYEPLYEALRGMQIRPVPTELPMLDPYTLDPS
ncbi:pPIWI_RE_Z domain-containing protein [Nocardia sp. NPDC055321]